MIKMYIGILTLLLSFMLAGCSANSDSKHIGATAAQTSQATSFGKIVYFEANKLKVPLDNTKWKLGYQDKNNISDIFEFNHLDQTVENWTELVTTRTLVGFKKKYTAKSRSENFIQYLYETDRNALKAVGKEFTKDNLGASYIVDEPNNVILCWAQKGIPNKGNPNNDDQIEFVRFFTTNDSDDIYEVHYAIKNRTVNDLSNDEQNTIMGIIRNTTLK